MNRLVRRRVCISRQALRPKKTKKKKGQQPGPRCLKQCQCGGVKMGSFPP